MHIETLLGLKIAWLENLSQISAAIEERCDIAQVIGEYPEFGFVRPEKIVWRVEIPKDIDSINIVKSLKMRKNLNNWITNLSEEKLSMKIENPLTETTFKQWFSHYLKLMNNKDRLNMHIKVDWLEEKLKQNKKAWGIFLYQKNYNGQETMLGGNIGVLGRDMLLVGYGAIQSIDDLKWNLGAVIDFESIKFAKEVGYDLVSFGKDNNFYGWYLSPGLFSYKTRLGLTPEADQKSPLITTKILSYEHLNDPVIMLRKKNEEYVTTIITARQDIASQEYEARGVSGVELINPDMG